MLKTTASSSGEEKQECHSNLRESRLKNESSSSMKGHAAQIRYYGGTSRPKKIGMLLFGHRMRHEEPHFMVIYLAPSLP